MVPKSQGMQRQAETNQEKAQKSQLPRRNCEGRIGGSILYQILELSFEDFTMIKVFLFVQWSCGKQRQLVAVTDGRWWWRRRLGVLGEGLGKKMEARWLFYATGRICSLQDLPKQNFACLGKLIQLRVAQAKFCLPGRILLQQILALQ